MRAGRQEGGVMPGSASPVGPLVADVSACAELLPGLRPWVRSRKKTQLPPIRGHDHAWHAARPAGAAEAPLRWSSAGSDASGGINLPGNG